MPGVVPTILPALDAIRAIRGILGLNPFTVTVRVRSWTGSRPGLGAPLDVDTVLVNQGADLNLYPVKVVQLSRQDVIASGGQYQSGDLRIGPMTPSYIATILAAGGSDDTTLDAPVQPITAREIIWIVSTNDGGTHGIPAGGIVAEKKGEENTAMHAFVIVRSTGRAPS
jgi:hypothetical protein